MIFWGVFMLKLNPSKIKRQDNEQRNHRKTKRIKA